MSRRAAEVVAALRDRGLTIATAESLTGGALASEIVSVPSASTVFVGGIVAYATRVKAEALGVDAALLARVGAIHPDVAEQMAQGARERMAADVAVATTGAAGPDPQDGHAPGEVWLGVATGAGVRSVRLDLGGDRAAIRRETVERALAEVLASLGE